MLRVALRGLRARGLRLALSGFAVVLGVGFVAGAFVLTDTLQQVFDDLFVTASSGTDVVVRPVQSTVDGNGDPSGADATLPLSLVDAVASVKGVASASPSIFFSAGLLKPDGEPYTTAGAPIFGQSYPKDEAASPYSIREGRAPEEPNEVVLDAGTAAATGYTVGGTVPVFTSGEAQDYRLVGIAGFGDADNLAGAGVLLFTVEQALQLSGTPDQVASIDVTSTSTTPATTLRDRIASALPSDAEAVTGAQQASDDAASVGEGLSFVTTFLLAFAAVALLVGSFLIFNTFTMLIAQRVRELALLRAVGASRRQVVTSVLVESATVGLVAGGVGVGAGILLALGLRKLIESFGGDLPDGPLVIAPRTIVVALLVGLVVTTLASLVPAVRASRIPPVAAMRDAALPESTGRRGTIVGVVLLVVGALVLAVGLSGNLLMAGLGALGVFLGIALLAPLLTRPFLAPFASVFRAVPGRVGARNAARNPRRTATTATALMIGVALVCAVSVVGSSVKASVAEVVKSSFSADLAVSESGFAQLGLDPSLQGQIEALPEVERVDPVPFGPVEVAAAGGTPKELTLTALPRGALGSTLTVSGVSGEVNDLSPGDLLLDDDQATALGLAVGDDVTLAPADADGPPRTVRLAGTYQPNVLADAGLLPEEDAKGLLDDPVTLLLVAGKGDVDATRSAVEKVTERFPSADVQTRDDLLGQVNSGIDQLLTFVNVLLALSVVVAFFGIVNTMALSVVERTRELGVLRAVGLSRRQMKRMVRVEALLVGVFGGVLGVLLGTVLGVALQRALVDQGFEVLSIPYGTLGLALVVSALAGVLAAVLPAMRAARMNVLEAVRTE